MQHSLLSRRIGWTLLAATLLNGVAFAQTRPVDKALPKIIFDSDMSSDHDDVGDLAILHGLASMSECEILGMMVSSQNGGTALLMDAINTWYGKPGIPIGVPADVGGIGGYAGVHEGYAHALKDYKTCPPAAQLYRKLLAQSPDKSVTIVTVGYLNNLKALLESKGDEFSPLDGQALVKQKVKLWSCAGGAFPKGDEFNFRVMGAEAYYTITHWPTAATYVPFDVGQAIYTCGPLEHAPQDNPIRRVYFDIKGGQAPYPSWGQIGVYIAVRGVGDLWGVNNTGSNHATEQGSNFWTDTPDPAGADDQAYLLERVRTPVRQSLDALISLPPNNGSSSKPGEPSDLRADAIGTTGYKLHWVDNAYNEDGFKLERREGDDYKLIATLKPDVTSYSDSERKSIANAAYRVRSFNAQGESINCDVYSYTGWTEINFAAPTQLPLYEYNRSDDLRPARPGPGGVESASRNDHVALNNDSEHGQTLRVDVDVSATGHQGNFYIYVLFQNADNWYRVNYGEKTVRLEKRIKGVTSTISDEVPMQNLGNGSPLQHWRVDLTPGSMAFIRELPQESVPGRGKQPTGVIVESRQPLELKSGKVGLGGWARTPVWENFHFSTSGK